ncbi:ribosome silencing factor [Selenomonas sp.]|uniref:ribosome silencing factor n=1 Tax=Selenomonas sp. TaxID=2053611 RepID=UPI003FA1C990
MSNTPEEISQAIAKAASDKKAEDIVILRMAELTTAADYFIVCSANTATQVRAIADNIEDELLEKHEKSYLHKEGYREGEWVLLDYGDCVAHVFMTESRAFYALERLWSDAPIAHYED